MGNITSYTLDTAGRLMSASDPDLRTWSYQYDADGNVTQQVDARGASGTSYAVYDGLNRLTKRSTDAGVTQPKTGSETDADAVWCGC